MTTDKDKDRAEFEAAIAGKAFGASFERRTDGEYLYSNTEFAWRAWQAARSRSGDAPVAPDDLAADILRNLVDDGRISVPPQPIIDAVRSLPPLYTAPPADARDCGAPTAIAWMQKWNLDLIASLPEGQSAHVGLSREPSEANNVPVYIDAPRATELLNSAIRSMQNLHEQIRPDDECEDGIVPAAALRKFVDEHAGLLYESSKMANSYRDTERLSFICENISGKEARRLGIVWSSGSLEDKRAAIDSAMGAGGGE